MSALDMIEELRWTPLPLSTIEHVMLFTFRSNDYVAPTLASLNSLASLPEVIYLHAGPIFRARNCRYESETFTHLLHARFPSIEAFQLFRKHPEFARVVGKVTNFVTVEWFCPPNSGPKIPLPGQMVNLSLFKFKGDMLRMWFGERCFYACLQEMKRTYVDSTVVKSMRFGTELRRLTDSGEPYSAGVVTLIGKSKKMKFDCLTTLFGERNERGFDYLMRVLMFDVDRFAGVYGIGIAKVISVDYKVMVPDRKSRKKSKLHLDALFNVLKNPTSIFMLCSMFFWSVLWA